MENIDHELKGRQGYP